MGSRWMASAFLLALLAPLGVQAQTPAQQRWVGSDDVRVRAGPGAAYRIVGSLMRGAPVTLHGAEQAGYCAVEGDGQSGHVACSLLSAQPLARSRAGAAGIDAAQRWVDGNGVILRTAPAPNAAVLARLSLNTIVKLVRVVAGGAYCEVQAPAGQTGFTACRYLATTPLVLAHVRGERRYGEDLDPAYDPERAFWLAPGWDGLARHAQVLDERAAAIASKAGQVRWPRDAALERMKAHLALGILGPKPRPYTDWAALKRKAAADLDLSGEARRLASGGKSVPAGLALRAQRTEEIVRELDDLFGAWLPERPNEGFDARPVRLVRLLELPAVGPSLFRSEAEVAPPTANAEQASGRFGIVFRQLVGPRPQLVAQDEEGGHGVYDMQSRTQVLARPVKRVRVFRDGRLRVEAVSLRSKEALWGQLEGPMCEGWVPGFGAGDADPAIWRLVDGGLDAARMNGNPPGSLYAFYTTVELTAAMAGHGETPQRLERAATGFVGGVLLHYDLNGDGIADFALWEGRGHGPGHLDGPTSSDDRWLRLAFVNINGAWKVLGSDIFAYGCGC